MARAVRQYAGLLRYLLGRFCYPLLIAIATGLGLFSFAAGPDSAAWRGLGSVLVAASVVIRGYRRATVASRTDRRLANRA